VIFLDINLNELMAEYARLPLNPHGAHYKKYVAGHREPAYSTKFSSFIFAVGGKAEIHLDGKTFMFGTNRIIHCAPNQRFTAKTDEPAELFELAYVNGSSYAGYMQSSYEMRIGNTAKIFSLLHRLTELSRNAMVRAAPDIDAHSVMQAKILTYSILSEMFSSAQSIWQTGIHKLVEDSKAYMAKHYREAHTLCALGGRYGMSGKYFAGLFKRYTGVSPIDYLITTRLEASKKLLQHTTYSIKEIGYSVGYDDSLYFSRHFKSRYGLPPSAWRKRILYK
jgi:AraC-like DNA-binding protein